MDGRSGDGEVEKSQSMGKQGFTDGGHENVEDVNNVSRADQTSENGGNENSRFDETSVFLKKSENSGKGTLIN